MYGRMKMMRSTKRRWFGFVAMSVGLSMLATPRDAEATLLAYEGFDYDAGGLHGLNGGFGWAGPWVADGATDVFVTPDAALNYTDSQGESLVTVGNGTEIDRVTRDGVRNLAVTQSTGTVWISFLMQPTYTDGPENALYVTLRYEPGADTDDSVLIGNFDGDDADEDGDGYGVRFQGESDGGNDPIAFSSVSGETNDLHFFVIKYAFGTAGQDDGSIHLFIDPDLGSEPLESSADVSLAGLPTDQMIFSGVGLLTPAGSTAPERKGYFDEIRVGTDFGDVAPIPEPASVVVLTLGGASLLLGRKRSA